MEDQIPFSILLRALYYASINSLCIVVAEGGTPYAPT